MEILVCIKQVPGTTQVEIDEETGVLRRDGVASKMNPYDLYALESAMVLKEKYGATVHVLTMGPPQAEHIIKEAYMMGADHGAILSDRKFAGADVWATAYTLSQGVKRFCKPDLIICGKMTTDGDTAQVGPEMAEFLGIPHIANVSKIVDVTRSNMTVEMDMPQTVEVAKVEFPCLITVEKGIFQPRLPSYKLKKSTAQLNVQYYAFRDLEDQDEMKYGLNGSPTQVKRIFPPVGNDAHEIWEGDSDTLTNQMFNALMRLKFI
ncbi:electron transfer flavoprotein subunit beta/FixA family protein [Fusibacter ferrireducens]|uniref:Electron transfer flavoprotein small subunit n=1 Tax=Fusibacter ferrireducens TaxID=2785058 RepID=A0ABR9ZSC3_9FIRM|nr:electron transfer flavoprotein subunit beta/FixA family protein [Fusibacter ferrireducens]MBF4693369.1 electron transfer flavoprotein subunit beta/FixA family protein [Fusibacter ferrireducens]